MMNLSPAVCRAGYLQFSGERRFTNSHVQSRAFFWCKSGTGRFIVNGETFTIKPRDLYILPWNRTISYEPDRKDPMFTGHVHLIPDYRIGSEWIPNVPHRVNDVAYNSPDRRDADWPNLRGVPRFTILGNDRIALLLDYTIRWFRRRNGSNEAEARHLGHLLVGELMLLRANEEQKGQNLPEELRRMVGHIDANYMRSPTVTELANIIQRSRSHVLKLFKSELGISAKRYIINKQLGEACEQLLSTTKSISEIGHAVGISDPYHFSKLFRRHIHLSPTEYRRNHGPVDVSAE
ncbi:MAG: AraC family transcriptional regulator [Puniceicoccaceae bacterium]